MKSEVIIAEIVQQLREAEQLEEEAASSHRAASTDKEQQPQVVRPVDPPHNDDNAPVVRSSRSRTRASAGIENRTNRTSNPQANSARRATGPSETREAKRRRVQIEEAQRLAGEAEEAAEQARVAKQRADIALATLRLGMWPLRSLPLATSHSIADENMPRAVGRTLYEREPTPIERPANATPLPSREPSPEPLGHILHATTLPLSPSSGDDEYDAAPIRLVDRPQVQFEGEDDDDKENDVYALDEEADKENISPPSPASPSYSPHSPTSPSILESKSQSPVASPGVSGFGARVYDQPEPVEPRPITKGDIRETLRKLTSVSLKLEGIQKEVDRSNLTVQKMRNTAKKGAKMIENNFAALTALEDHVLVHVKRNPTILDGNGFDEENGGPAREDELRRAYYSQQRKDQEEIQAKEAEKARRKRLEQAVREAAKVNKEALEEGASGSSSDGSLELDPVALDHIKAGGDLASLLDLENPREQAKGGSEEDDEEDVFLDSDFSSEEEEEEQRPSDDGAATPPRVTWAKKKKNVDWGTEVSVKWVPGNEDGMRGT